MVCMVYTTTLEWDFLSHMLLIPMVCMVYTTEWAEANKKSIFAVNNYGLIGIYNMTKIVKNQYLLLIPMV